MRQELLKIRGEEVKVTLPDTLNEARELWGDTHLLALASAEFRRSVRSSRRPEHKALAGRLSNLSDAEITTLLNRLKEKKE